LPHVLAAPSNPQAGSSAWPAPRSSIRLSTVTSAPIRCPRAATQRSGGAATSGTNGRRRSAAAPVGAPVAPFVPGGELPAGYNDFATRSSENAVHADAAAHMDARPEFEVEVDLNYCAAVSETGERQAVIDMEAAGATIIARAEWSGPEAITGRAVLARHQIKRVEFGHLTGAEHCQDIAVCECGTRVGEPEYPDHQIAALAEAGYAVLREWLPADAPAVTDRWRVGGHYGIHVYCGDSPVATFFTPGEARRAVEAHNADMSAE